MDFGGFAGGFSHGFNNGVGMAKTIRDVIKDRKLQDLREQGMAEAEAQRAKAVNDAIKEGKSDAPASGPVEATPSTVAAPEAAPAAPTPASVAAQGTPALSASSAPGVPAPSDATTPAAAIATPVPAAPAQAVPAGPGYDTAGEAEASAAMAAKAAAGAAGPTPANTAAAGVAPVPAAVPVKQKPNGKFTVNGQSYETREQAQAAAERSTPSSADLFMKNAVPKIAAEYLAQGDPAKAKAWEGYAESHNGKRAMKDWADAYTAPDFDTAVTKFGKYYSDHINDGVDYTGHKLLTKADGSQVAVVTLKDKTTGKSTEMELTRQTMLQMGGANNPQKLFETAQAEQLAANKMKAEAAIKREDRAYTRDTELLKQAGTDKRELRKEERDNAREDRKDAREDRRGEQRVNEIELKDRLSADNAAKYKKATDPVERRALIRSDAMKNDTKFPRMTMQEQKKYLDDAMESIDGKQDGASPAPASTAPGAAKPSTAVIETKPMPYQAGAPVKYNKQDGKPYHLIDGKYIPIEGGVVPKAKPPGVSMPADAATNGLPPMMKPKM